MSLLAVLLAVILQYFAERGKFLVVPDHWIAGYWQSIESHLLNMGWRVGVILAVVPVLVALWLAQFISSHFLRGLLDFAIALAVLLVTLRMRNYRQLFVPYFKALAAQDYTRGEQVAHELLGLSADGDCGEGNIENMNGENGADWAIETEEVDGAGVTGSINGNALRAKVMDDGRMDGELTSEPTNEFIEKQRLACTNRQLGRWLSLEFFRGWFVGLFWFGIFGVYGAATYWLWRQLAAEARRRLGQQARVGCHNATAETADDGNLAECLVDCMACKASAEVSVEGGNGCADNGYSDQCSLAGAVARRDNASMESLWLGEGAREAGVQESNLRNYREAVTCFERCLYWAEYLPVRVWAIGYALVGEFVPTFDWLTGVLWSRLTSERIIERSGGLALGCVLATGAEASKEDTPVLIEAMSDAGGLQRLLSLNHRLFVAWLVLLIFSGVWAFLM